MPNAAPSAPQIEEFPEPPRRSHVAPALIALDRVDDDDHFRLREVGEVAPLATDIARLGQLFPIDVRFQPPDRFQVITGFRRVAALKLLHREKVLARLHTDLSEEDALLLALAEGIHQTATPRDELQAAFDRLSAQGRLSPTARAMFEKALQDEALAPEGHEDAAGDEAEEEEVEADELAADVTVRMADLNQDLALLAEVFAELEPARRRDLLGQLKYASQLVEFLESKS